MSVSLQIGIKYYMASSKFRNWPTAVLALFSVRFVGDRRRRQQNEIDDAEQPAIFM